MRVPGRSGHLETSTRRRLALAAFALPIVAGLLAAAAPAQATTAPAATHAGVASSAAGLSSQVAASVKGDGSAARAQALSSYWTPARMNAARNLDPVTVQRGAVRTMLAQAHPDGPAVRVPGAVPTVPGSASGRARPLTGSVGSPWTGNFYSPPATTSGKVFFTDHLGGSWVCSASTVNSAGKDIVFTAGHCVYGTAGGKLPAGETWHSNWTFVPDYSNGYEPYGAWYACQLWTRNSYISSQDLQDDMGAAVMCTNNGQHIVNVVGGQGIEWNYPSNQYVYDFGYPAEAPFNGQVLDECDGYEFASPYVSGTDGLGCNFTGGSSGGPWLAAFGGTFGYLTGVNSFTLNGLSGEMFSPYFGNNAANLYNSVAAL